MFKSAHCNRQNRTHAILRPVKEKAPAQTGAQLHERLKILASTQLGGNPFRGARNRRQYALPVRRFPPRTAARLQRSACSAVRVRFRGCGQCYGATLWICWRLPHNLLISRTRMAAQAIAIQPKRVSE